MNSSNKAITRYPRLFAQYQLDHLGLYVGRAIYSDLDRAKKHYIHIEQTLCQARAMLDHAECFVGTHGESASSLRPAAKRLVPHARRAVRWLERKRRIAEATPQHLHMRDSKED
jgi:hypothetical protein